MNLQNNMGNPTLIQKYITWPIQEFFTSRRMKAFEKMLLRHGMDFGIYYMEELTKMYHAHSKEIDRY